MRFKHKIDILVNIAKSEITGPKWEKTKEIYADISQLCDNRFISLENLSFGDVLSEEYYIFHIRYLEEIDSCMRIKFGEKIFEIKRIINKNFSNKILSIIALEI